MTEENNLVQYFRGLSPEQLRLAQKLVEKKFTAGKAFDPAYLGAATALSRTQLMLELLMERKRPLEAQAKTQKAALDAQGHRPGPSPAYRWIAAKVAPSRSAWDTLSPAEKDDKENSLRENLMLTDEFARLFPAEAYEKRRKAGVEPAILVSIDGVEPTETTNEVVEAEVAVDQSESEGVATAAV